MIAVQSFPALEVSVTRRQGHVEVKMLSQITATFSVELCVKSAASPVCQTTETHSVHVVGVAHSPGETPSSVNCGQCRFEKDNPIFVCVLMMVVKGARSYTQLTNLFI